MSPITTIGRTENSAITPIEVTTFIKAVTLGHKEQAVIESLKLHTNAGHKQTLPLSANKIPP
eukprot:6376760-Karenia_brevis.AAC.1